jgi:epoxyqueuosine reductase QueG
LVSKTKWWKVTENNTFIVEWLKSQGVDVFGIGNMALYDRELVGINRSAVERLPFALSIGLVLSKGVLDTVLDGPNPLYLHHYRQLNYRLDMIGYLLSREIEKKGYKALPFAASQVIDWQNQKGHLSHKHIGVLSGVGWIGRNNLLIHPMYGAHVRYNTILTDMPLEAQGPLNIGCGECRACIDRCPAGAVKDEQSSFDHQGCYNMLTQFKNKRNLGHHICGICIEACKGER